MVISKEKVDKAREIKQKFMDDNRKNTSLKVNWSQATMLDLAQGLKFDNEEEFLKRIKNENY